MSKTVVRIERDRTSETDRHSHHGAMMILDSPLWAMSSSKPLRLSLGLIPFTVKTVLAVSGIEIPRLIGVPGIGA